HPPGVHRRTTLVSAVAMFKLRRVSYYAAPLPASFRHDQVRIPVYLIGVFGASFTGVAIRVGFAYVDVARRQATLPLREIEAGAPVWLVEDLVAGAAARGATRPRTIIHGGEPALIVYTSGTTGTAKGAVLTHDNLAANARTLIAAWRITEADRYLAMLPLFHVHGLANGIHSWLATGCLM